MKKTIKTFIKSIFVAIMMFSATMSLSPAPVFAATVADSYTDTSKINTGASSGYQVASGQLKLVTQGANVAWWKMDEASGSTISDSSGNSNNGFILNTMNIFLRMNEAANDTCSGGQDACDSSPNGYHATATGTTIVAGKYGNGRSFNGTSDLLTPGDLPDLASGTIEFWFKPTSTFNSSSASTQGLWGKKQDDNFNATISLRGTDFLAGDGTAGKIQAKMENTGGTYLATTTASWTGGTWYHYALVWGGGVTTVYVNGTQENTTATSKTLTGAANDEIGRSYYDSVSNISGGGPKYFNGVIDDFRRYDYIRTGPQVTADMNDTAGPSVVAGQYSNARSFNGTNDYILSSASHNFTSEAFTIEMWINPTSIANSPVLFSNGTYQTGGYYMHLNSNGSVTFRTNQSAANQDSSTAAGTFTTGSWQHLAITRSGASVRIYKNGTDVTSSAGTHINPASTTQKFTLGTYGPSPATWYYTGSVDDLRIYNTARSQSEVQADMNNAVYGTSATIVSTNLLTGISGVDSIDEFVYNLSAKPAGTTATVQFSQNGTSWYSSAGTLDATDTLSTGSNNTITIHSLGWTGSNFYYKVAFGGDGSATPVLDDVTLNYTTSGYSSSSGTNVDSYTDTSQINSSSSTNEAISSGALGIASNIDIGDGADGAVVVNANKNINTESIAAVMDSSSNAYHGTPTGTRVVGGKYGNARDFAGGTENINLGNVLDQTGANPFSIEAWVKTKAGGATVYTIVSKNLIGSPYTGYQLGFNVVTASAGDAGKIGFFLSDTTPTYFRRQTTTAYNDGVWHHVAVSYDGSKTRAGALIYIDGSLATVTDHDSASFSGSTSNAANLEIGARNGTNQPFVGQIDDVRFYNYVRSSGQIVEDRDNGTITGNAPVGWWKFNEANVPDGANYQVTAIGSNTVTLGANPTAHWKMDETADNSCAGGQDACDSSGNGYHGTATGTTITGGKYSNGRSFNGTGDVVSLPAASIPTGNQVTLEFWAYGYTNMPVANSAFYSADAGGVRTLNVHLPWTDGNVYWDSGGSGGTYDRISKAASAADYKNRWTHWAFVKNATTGSMKIYLDGTLWHSGTGLTRTLTTSTSANIGGTNYSGMIDDVRLYNYERSATQILEDMRPASAGLASGDRVMLVNLQGDATNYSNVGNFEILTAQSVTGNTVTFTGNVTKTYGVGGNANLTGQKIIVQRVPNYTNLTINSGVTLTANAWDGTKGGIVAFLANGTVSVSGTISVNSLGFRGGSGAPGPNQNNGYNGEGTNNPTSSQSGCQNIGGGSAGAYTSGTTGGGGGSYGTSGTNGASSPITCDGFPGTTYGAAGLDQLYLGSGGGGGSSWGDGTGSGSGGAGATGGGMVVISTDTLTVSGTVSANGGNGSNGVTHGAGGGGGSGGTVLISAESSVTTGTMTATGGTGGTAYVNSNGGNGGAGRIGIGSNGTITGTTNPTYNSSAPIGDGTYLTSATIISTNLLAAVLNISSIDGITYNLATLPAGTTATIQFSKDATNWYNSSGTISGTDNLTTGVDNTIDLSALAWSGSFFYYKIAYTSDGSATPTLSDITVDYTVTTSNEGSTWASCTPLSGGDFTITDNCYFPNTRLTLPETNIDGVDNGNLSVAAYKSLTIRGDQQIVRNNGKSVSLGTSASIVINDIPIGGVGGNVRDYSGNGNEGAAKGTTVVAGQYDKARSFNGVTDYIDIINETPFDFERTNSFTVSFWMKTSGSANAVLVSKMLSSGNLTGWEIVQPSADPAKVQVNMISTSSSNEARKRSSVNVNTGAWKHIAFTYDGSSTAAGINIYIDGVLDSSATTVTDILSASILNDVDLNIGARNTTVPYNGQLDDIRIYNYVRTAEQITLDKDYAPNPTGNGPIAWWRFEDGGQLKETNLWVQDNDGDGWGFSYDTQQRAQNDSPGTGWVRRNQSKGSALGDGRDGNITFTTNTNLNTYNHTGRSCADGGDMVNYNISSFGTTTVLGQSVTTAVLSSTPSSGCLRAGDQVLVINLQGTSANYTNVGNYERFRVYSVSGSTITFTSAKTKYYGNGAADDTNLGTGTTNQRVMMQRMPQYGNVTVNSGVELSPNAWDGSKGGVLAFVAKETVTVTGTILSSIKGYRGSSTTAGGGEAFCSVNGGGGSGNGGAGGAGGIYDGVGTPGSIGTAGTNAVCGGGGGASGGGGAGGEGEGPYSGYEPARCDPDPADCLCRSGQAGGGAGSPAGTGTAALGGGGGNGGNGGGGGGQGDDDNASLTSRTASGGGVGGTGGGGGYGSAGTAGAGGSGGATGACSGSCGGCASGGATGGGGAGTSGGSGASGSGGTSGVGGTGGGVCAYCPGAGAGAGAGGGGGGGGTYGIADLSKIYFGAGGGRGGATGASGSVDINGQGGAAAAGGAGGTGGTTGGTGGGIIIIFAKTLTVTGAINASGTNPGGTGGGGAGGSIKIMGGTLTLGTTLVVAPGGGNGGAGRVAVGAATSVTGTSNPTYTSITGP